MTDEQKVWLDTELWNFVHAVALDLGLAEDKNSDDSPLYNEVRKIINVFDRAGGSRE